MTNDLVIYGENICAFPHILGSPSSYMTLHPIPSEFPYICGKKEKGGSGTVLIVSWSTEKVDGNVKAAHCAILIRETQEKPGNVGYRI